MDAAGLLAIASGAALADNLVLVRLVGVCPAVSGRERMGPCLGLGISLVLAVTVASVASVALDRYVIAPLGLGHLRTMVLVSVVAGSSVLALRLMPGAPARRGGAQAGSPAVLVGNCAVFAAALLAVERQYSLIVTLVYALAAGLGVLAVTAAMAGLRSRAELGPVPAAFRGLPVGLLTGGLAALAFMGFIGMGSR